MSVRLAYRIGRLEIKNSEISWKYYADEMDKQPAEAGQAGTDSRLSNFQNSRYSNKGLKPRMFSYNRDELTVMTPKVESRAASFIGRRSFGSRAAFSSTFHISNPNPQIGDNIFKGARDMGYKKYYESNTDRDPMNSVIKFGKKVDY